MDIPPEMNEDDDDYWETESEHEVAGDDDDDDDDDDNDDDDDKDEKDDDDEEKNDVLKNSDGRSKEHSHPQSKYEAAINIQRNFRGFLARRHLEEEGKTQPDESQSKATREEISTNAEKSWKGRERAASEAVSDKEKAAVNIQKHVRGFLTRKRTVDRSQRSSVHKDKGNGQKSNDKKVTERKFSSSSSSHFVNEIRSSSQKPHRLSTGKQKGKDGEKNVNYRDSFVGSNVNEDDGDDQESKDEGNAGTTEAEDPVPAEEPIPAEEPKQADEPPPAEEAPAEAEKPDSGGGEDEKEIAVEDLRKKKEEQEGLAVESEEKTDTEPQEISIKPDRSESDEKTIQIIEESRSGSGSLILTPPTYEEEEEVEEEEKPKKQSFRQSLAGKSPQEAAASAATVIQAQFRGFKQAKQMAGRKDAALKIQRYFRGFMARKRFADGGVDAAVPLEEARCTCSPETISQPDSPLPDARLKDNVVVTIKFAEKKTMTISTTLESKVVELKRVVASYLVFRAALIDLSLEGWIVDDDTVLLSLLEKNSTSITLTIDSKDPPHMPLPPLINPPRIRIVRVVAAGERCGVKLVTVRMERDFRRKFFLGGYRHKLTGLEYHHATSQTPKPRAPITKTRFHRDAQTVVMVDKAIDTPEETNTQMSKIGCYMTIGSDRIMYPTPLYITADEYHAVLVAKAIIIQKYWRRWLAQRRVARMKEWLRRQRKWEAEKEMRRKREREARLRSEFDRRMNPKTKEDFDILFHALETWRRDEVARIDATLTGAERKAELCRLLDQESEFIRTIGKHQNNAGEMSKFKGIAKFLKNASSPKTWKGPDGKRTCMDTPMILRARELKDLYDSVCMKHLGDDERLDVLLSVKEVVYPYRGVSKFVRELLELMDRESDLMMRRMKRENLSGLRQRIETLFLEFVRDPEFNPEARQHHRMPQDPSVLRGKIYMCNTCLKYRPIKEFHVVTTSNSPGTCRVCMKHGNDAHDRIDFGFYGVMLRRLQRAEEAYDDDSRVCHLMRYTDVKHLVDDIWQTRSALSRHDDIYDLVLLRWNKKEEWSPWNCVLLTKEEAEAHLKLDDFHAAYDELYLRKIAQRHNAAKSHFMRVPWMVKYVRSKTTKRAAPTMDPPEGHVEPSCRIRRHPMTGNEVVVHEVACGHKLRSQLVDTFMVRAMALGNKKKLI